MKRFKVQQACLVFIGLIMSVFLITGCGGNGGETDKWLPPSNPDTTAPTVTAVVPLNNATGVAINTKIITAAFSEAMDSATLTTASFTLACPAGTPVTGGAVTYLAAGYVAALTLPAANLPTSTVCTATITTGAKDVAGNALASNFIWTFTTGVTADTTRPRVTITVPATTDPGPTLNAPTNTLITAVFTEDMNPLTILAAGTFTVVNTTDGGTPVTGAAIPVAYAVGSKTATFTPAAVLTAGKTYTATITTAATDLAGNALAGNQASLPAASNYVWVFTTAAAVPAANVSVLSTDPAASAGGVCPGATINATFTVPSGLRMDPNSVIAGTTFIVTGPSPSVALVPATSVSLDVPTGLIATFTPLNPLAVGTYTVTIKGGASGVKDLAIPANTMVSDYTWTFTVVSGSCLAKPILGAASTFGIAATAGIVNVGATTVEGDVVLDPLATCNYVTVGSAGLIGSCNGVPPTIYGTVISPLYPDAGVTSLAVKNALRQTYIDISPPNLSTGVSTIPDGTVMGTTGVPVLHKDLFYRGVYKTTAGGMVITGDLTLDAQGNPDAVFVFQSDSTLGMADGSPTSYSRILLINGAKASNVWWWVGSAATFGTYSEFQGNVLVYSDLTMKTGATSCGRLFAGASTDGAFTFGQNVVSVPGQPFAPGGTRSTICE
jgi:Ice-binding-like/Bacterial Ig-like domain